MTDLTDDQGGVVDGYTDGAAAQTYYLYDGLGSTTDLTDGSGNSVASYGYGVFGVIRSQSGSSGNHIE